MGLRYIKSLTSRPVGFNALIEASNRTYLERMKGWIDIALEEGIRFFITSLGDPKWVCERVHAVGGFVYHDVTEAKWAQKGVKGGVDGLIAVNSRAGGHAGTRSAEALLEELRPFGLPLVAAGGVGTEEEFARHIARAIRRCSSAHASSSPRNARRARPTSRRSLRHRRGVTC